MSLLERAVRGLQGLAQAWQQEGRDLVESIKEFEETWEEVTVLRDIEVEKVLRQMRNAIDQDEESGRQVRR